MAQSEPSAPLWRAVGRAVALTGVVAAVYFVSAHLSAFWATDGRTSTPIYPGVGVALAVLIFFGRQYWPTIFVGRLLAFVIADPDREPWLLPAIAAANTAAVWTAAWLLARGGRLDPALNRLRDVLWLGVGGGVTTSTIGATLGAAAMWWAGEISTAAYPGTWLRWWMGSLGGVLVVTPLVLAWAAGGPWPRTWRAWWPLLLAVIATSIASAWVFLGETSALTRTWFVFPVLLWSSLGFGVRGATLALLPATIIGIVGTAMGSGVLGYVDGSEARYEMLQQFVTAASFTCLVLAVVADERRGTQALHDREQRLHMALAAARSFGFDYEPATDRVTRTAECADILGLPSAQAERGRGADYYALIHEDDRALMVAAESQLTPASPTVTFTYRLRRPDGSVIHLEETARAEFDHLGHVIRVVGVTIDVTERRRTEREREDLLAREQAARAEAERATLLRDEFLGTVSHELRTPLNAILGWAQILLAGPRTPEALQSGLATIARNARLQTQLIDDLLDLSRLGAGRLHIEATPVDLGLVVRESVLAVTPAAKARQVDVQVDLPAVATLVAGDADRLQQVCWNLLQNAVKFTEPGGKVRVRVEQAAGQHQLIVSDTGRGISADFLPHVFDRFRQADGSTSRRHSGLGIGLSLVRQIVELHGGQVAAESRGEGLGATFTVSIPARPADQTPSPALTVAPLQARAGGLPARLTVLVVDDDADARDVVTRLLDEEPGTRVVTAASADEALRLVQDQRPDVVVTDIGMPGTDGYAFLRALRALPPDAGATTPAIALTALVRDEDRARSLDAGFLAHLAKPVTRDALQQAVHRAWRDGLEGSRPAI